MVHDNLSVEPSEVSVEKYCPAKYECGYYVDNLGLYVDKYWMTM